MTMIDNKLVEDIQITAENRDKFDFLATIPKELKPDKTKMELVTVLWYSKEKAERYGMIVEEKIEDPMSPEDTTLFRSTLMQIMYVASNRPDLSFAAFSAAKGNPLNKGYK